MLALWQQVNGQAGDAGQQHVTQQTASYAHLEHHQNADAYGNRFEAARHSAGQIYIATQVVQMQRQAEVDHDQSEPNDQD